jgi:hypothetical protein
VAPEAVIDESPVVESTTDLFTNVIPVGPVRVSVSVGPRFTGVVPFAREIRSRTPTVSDAVVPVEPHCLKPIVGIESASEQVRIHMKKAFSDQAISHHIKMCSKYKKKNDKKTK